jgi:hypothetical protein
MHQYRLATSNWDPETVCYVAMLETLVFCRFTSFYLVIRSAFLCIALSRHYLSTKYQVSFRRININYFTNLCINIDWLLRTRTRIRCAMSVTLVFYRTTSFRIRSRRETPGVAISDIDCLQNTKFHFSE